MVNNARPPICVDVAEWGRDRGLQVRALHEPVWDEIWQFASEDPSMRDELRPCEDDLRRPQTLLTIEGAVVRELDGLVILPDGHFCLQGNWYRHQLEEHYAYRRRMPYRPRRLKGDIYSLLSVWSATYYHWFHDTLPRLVYAQPHLPAGTRFLLNENPHGYQLESLKAFGISESLLELQPPRTDTQVERLWFATPLGHASFTSGEALCEVADRIKKHYKIAADRAGTRRIYVSRAKASRRQVLNEEAIVPLLREHKFEVLLCEGLSFADQVGRFSEAELVVGPHGAGLTNILYAPKGSRVGEFHGVESNSCFAVMVRQLGLHYHRLEVQDGAIPGVLDMILDPTGFSRWLEELVQSGRQLGPGRNG